jgi:hypothetical protein
MAPTFLEQARQLVSEAEKSVKGLLVAVAEQGDYDALERVTAVARGLQRIRMETESAPTRPSGPTEFAPSPGAPRAQAQATYPLFFRTGGDKLRMIGWTKNGEYTHDAPRVVLDAMVDTLRDAGGLEEPIPLGEILPQLVHPETGQEFPEYHSRTFMRWLRTIGVVKKEGHKGYFFAKGLGDDPWPTIEDHWNRLTVRD